MTTSIDLVAPRREERHPSSPGRPESRVTLIVPTGGWPPVDLRELWEYRGLFMFLVWRGIKVRYAQTVLGIGWAVLQPVLTMLVFTAVFGHVARIPSEGVPYAVFSLPAVVLWSYFASAFNGASGSLLVNTNLITKVYFPRLVIPLAPVVAALVDFAIAFAVVLLVLLWHGIVPRPEALLLVPLTVVITGMVAAGTGCALAALNLQYRDARFIAPFLVQAWMFVSPVVYSAWLVPAPRRWLYMLNPLAPVITALRAVLLGTSPVPWGALGQALVTAVVLLVLGGRLFKRYERVFADVA
ncbi:MAG TPA: ABC transporter permease [Gemmatimonadales bacterium]|nr:ABC transporter permease [Gemmatimonadales bacterium]